VAHTVDTHHANRVGDLVNHTVIADADAPIVFAARQLAATGRTRLYRERLDAAIIRS
jgi:hypothetical protein